MIRALVVSIVLAVSTLAAANDAIDVPELKPPPKLDGVLDDAAWKSAPKIDTLYLLKADTPVKGTTIYLGRDRKWLYLAFQCDNANMPHVSQTIFKHDQSACQDDSVEVFFAPDGEQYGHFMLSFANVRHDKKIVGTRRDITWNPPWRSATRRSAKGWTAEMAIPLYAMGSSDLADARINLMRNQIRIELDPYGAKQDEKRDHYLLGKNVESPHDTSRFRKLDGLGGFKPEIPFVPAIDAVGLSSYQQQGERTSYNVALALRTDTPVVGEATIKVIESKDGRDIEKIAETVEVSGRKDVSLNVSVTDFRSREVRIVLEAPDTGDLLAEERITDTSMLNVIRKAILDREYYTTETTAKLQMILGLPDTALRTSTVRVAAANECVAELGGLQREVLVEIPVEKLHLGTTLLAVSLVDRGRELAATTVEARRLEPRPGFEVKADYFRGTILKDGKPFFPIGICAHRLRSQDEYLFKYLSEEIGFNTLVRSGRYESSLAVSDVDDVKPYMEVAAKYGFCIVNWSLKQPKPIEGKPLAERLKIHRKRFDELTPVIVRESTILRDCPNMLAYWNVDEPNLLNADARIAAAEWYWKAVHPVDPYRPLFLLYSKHIPPGDNWTRWGQILGYDVYPRPYYDSFFSDPGLCTAYYVYELRERCRRDNKILWMVPLANVLDPARSPVGMSKAHMLCQAYISIIYGARGLLYFSLPCVVGESTWDALKTITVEVKEMAPALLNAAPEQTVRYTPDDFRPAERKFPMVNAAVFKHPADGHLLLAANIKPFAVDTTFSVDGLTAAERSFGDSAKLTRSASSFTERIEPYGVRAYKIKLGDPPRVDVAVDMKPVEDVKAPFVDVLGIINQVKLGKNHCPNPCFKRCMNRGIPDFYRPFFCLDVDIQAGRKGSSWYVHHETTWNGNPSLRMYRGPLEDEGTRGLFGACYPPSSRKPQRMTFSFYAKGQSSKDKVCFIARELGKANRKFDLTEDWQRCHVTFDVPPGPDRNMGARIYIICPVTDSTVWISGLQLEAGDTPTEFQDDSVLKEAKVREDPDNLIRNGHAEYGDARYWQSSRRRDQLTTEAKSGRFSFRLRNPACSFQSDLVAIDPAFCYRLSGSFKARGGTPRLTFGLLFHDQEKRPIRSWNIRAVKATETALAAGCAKGDRILRVKDASKWQPGHHVAFKPEGGVPNFHVTESIDSAYQAGDVWVIHLRAPCAYEYPAGTRIAAHRASNNGIFPCIGEVPTEWTDLSGEITPAMMEHWPGARYACVAILPDLPEGREAELLADDISLRIVDAETAKQKDQP